MALALALMFHGIDGEASRSAGYAADPHYTVRRPDFDAMLAGLLAQGLAVGAARDQLDLDDGRAQVWITFDDGDASNRLEAVPALLAVGVRADFFVNPARVGREGFMGWDDLRELAALGMSIQSHGHTHAYFTHLDATALREELRASKETLEQRLGHAVTLLAPPGGRVPRGLVPLARSLGYRAVLDSTPGRIDGRKGHEVPLPRVAVTSRTTVPQVLAWASLGGRGIARLRWRHRLLSLAKRALGDERYEHWRGRLLEPAA